MEAFDETYICHSCGEAKCASSFSRSGLRARRCRACAKICNDRYIKRVLEACRDTSDETHLCRTCGETKNVSLFTQKGLFLHKCRACVKAYNDRYNRINADKIKNKPKYAQTDNTEQTHICRTCGEEKSVRCFIFRRDSGKYYNNCRECSKLYYANYYRKYSGKIISRVNLYAQTHKEVISKRSKAYRAAHLDDLKVKKKIYYARTKELFSGSKKAYRKTHKEKLNRYSNEYYYNNKERLITAQTEYKKAHRDLYNIINRRRKQQARELPGRHTAEDIEEIYLEQLGKCVYCGCSLRFGYSADHIIPVGREGSSDYAFNIQLLCQSCNSSKNNRTHEEYLVYLEKAFPSRYEKFKTAT